MEPNVATAHPDTDGLDNHERIRFCDSADTRHELTGVV
jgi:hypothetical protein